MIHDNQINLNVNLAKNKIKKFNIDFKYKSVIKLTMKKKILNHKQTNI